MHEISIYSVYSLNTVRKLNIPCFNSQHHFIPTLLVTLNALFICDKRVRYV